MNDRESGLFERYAELREIGAGGMARVVLAHDRMLERQVALKLLRTSELELMRRLRDEGRLTARCRHKNVIGIHEIGHENGCPYLVLEYLSGKPLSALLSTGWRLPYARAIELFLPVLQAVEHIHGVGVIHRDLTPNNIFLMDAGPAKLIDFGIAKLSSSVAAPPRAACTRSGTLVGTYECMSPEQWNCVGIDHLTDIWACGIVLYQMICGCHPLQPRHGAQLMVTAMKDHAMPSMSTHAPPGVPQELIGIIDRCLSKQKAWRWQSPSRWTCCASSAVSGRRSCTSAGMARAWRVPARATSARTRRARCAFRRPMARPRRCRAPRSPQRSAPPAAR